jgi:nucleoside-diphosphate-sugar epimerase
MTRRALITGATGFIGGRLAAKLVDLGWTVHALVRPSSNVSALPAALHVHVFEGSARQLAALAADIRPDVTFHLASLYVADHAPEQVETLIAANVLFPVQLAQALSDLGPARLLMPGRLAALSGSRLRSGEPVRRDQAGVRGPVAILPRCAGSIGRHVEDFRHLRAG